VPAFAARPANRGRPQTAPCRGPPADDGRSKTDAASEAAGHKGEQDTTGCEEQQREQREQQQQRKQGSARPEAAALGAYSSHAASQLGKEEVVPGGDGMSDIGDGASQDGASSFGGARYLACGPAAQLRLHVIGARCDGCPGVS
jgi:hypothetical protein